MVNNENYELCKKCGGNCCKSFACSYVPEDFSDKELTREDIVKILDRGNISIDSYFNGNEDPDGAFSYFLRPRHKAYNEGTNEHLVYDVKKIDGVNDMLVFTMSDESYGGECCFLTENGCMLSWEDRPTGGKELIPIENDIIPGASCETFEDRGKQYYAKRWSKYNKILEEIFRDNEYDTTQLRSPIVEWTVTDNEKKCNHCGYIDLYNIHRYTCPGCKQSTNKWKTYRITKEEILNQNMNLNLIREEEN